MMPAIARQRRPEYRSHRRGFRFLVASGMLAGICLTGAALHAQNAKPTEYDVEAAYLSNFGRFVEWPVVAGASAPSFFDICLVGTDPFGPALDAALKGEEIRGVPMMPRRLNALDDAANCRILYLGFKDERLRSAMAALKPSSTLTVSDAPDFVAQGGMIQFVIDGNRVRFQINLAAAQRAKLNLSSELLKLATSILRAP